MSNNPIRLLLQESKRLFGVVFAVAVLYLSAQMTAFGFLHAKIDLAEVGQPEKLQKENEKLAEECRDWQFQIGYRLICQKAIVADYFRNHFIEISDPNAKILLDRVLTISPLEPAYYLMRARIGLLEFQSGDEIIPLIRMSYLAGRGEQALMYQRFQIGFALWNFLDQTDKSFVINDYIRSYSNERDMMYASILSASNSIFSEIVEMVRYRDPATYQMLLQGRQDKSHP